MRFLHMPWPKGPDTKSLFNDLRKPGSEVLRLPFRGTWIIIVVKELREVKQSPPYVLSCLVVYLGKATSVQGFFIKIVVIWFSKFRPMSFCGS